LLASPNFGICDTIHYFLSKLFIFIFFSGADLAALIREASEIAMTDHISKCLSTENACVHQSHIDRAFSKILPSVSEKVIIFSNKFSYIFIL
jgi:SpoVK/Ycf46/Vps4 family AAA+-type ATPase